jgi:hypothetical protein
MIAALAPFTKADSCGKAGDFSGKTAFGGDASEGLTRMQPVAL